MTAHSGRAARRFVAALCLSLVIAWLQVSSTSAPAAPAWKDERRPAEVRLGPGATRSPSWYQTPHDEAGVKGPLSEQWIADVRAVNGCDPECKNYVLVGGLQDPDGNGIPDGTPVYRVAPTAADTRIPLYCFLDPCNWPSDPKVPIPTCLPDIATCFLLNLPATPPFWLAADSDDSGMVLFDRNVYPDRDGDYAVWLWQVCPPVDLGAPVSDFCLTDPQHLDHPKLWTAHGLAVTYLYSNGLPGCWPSHYANSRAAPWIGFRPEVHNSVHFGVPAHYQALRFDEVSRAGSSHPVEPVPHMLKIVLPGLLMSSTNYFPSTGSDGDGGEIPMGMVIRIKPSLQLTLDMFGGNRYALALALTMQRYGAILGDSGGTVAAISAENLQAEGSRHTWDDLGIDAQALSPVPLGAYQFLYGGFGGPSRHEWLKAGQQCEDEPGR